jgi:beta-phosphoglucomutase family hydrolase
MIPAIESKVEIPRERFDAVIFDMDGVVTQTATLHAEAWKQLFDEVLAAELEPWEVFRPFDVEDDYRRYVDGKSRYDGIVSFLRSRGICLPYGNASDPPTEATVCGLGNRKDVHFWQLVEERGVDVFESTVRLIRDLKAAGISVGIFSASRNATSILKVANVLALFDAKVDGVDADALGLKGKPDPAMLLELTRKLRASPARTVVVEDAIAGVEAGRAGGFALVICVKVTRSWTARRERRRRRGIRFGYGYRHLIRFCPPAASP